VILSPIILPNTFYSKLLPSPSSAQVISKGCRREGFVQGEDLVRGLYSERVAIMRIEYSQ